MKTAYGAHIWLEMLYNHILMSTEEGEKAYEYLKNERCISNDTIKTFKIGYALKDSNLMINILKNKGFNINAMVERKIINVSQNGNYFDPFYDRIIFPIYDFKDEVCGFGGRTMNKDNKIKYLNSPETRIYKKQDNLYGLKQAKGFVEEEGYLILFEGFFDVLQAYQNGVKNCVASLGTALTLEQALLIKSITNNVVIILDNDEAGINASARSASILEDIGVNTLIGSIENAEDPDEYFKKYQDKERFINEIIKKAINRKEFYITKKIESIDLNNANQRFSFLNDLMMELPNDLEERNSWLQLANEHLHFPTRTLLEIIKRRGA